MRAYSMDLRERVLHDSDAGMQAAAVASKYRVSASWVRRLKQRRRETGEVAPRQQRYGRHPVLASQLHTLAALIREQPDRTLAELQVVGLVRSDLDLPLLQRLDCLVPRDPHRAVLRQTQSHRAQGPLSVDRHALALARRVPVALHSFRVSQLCPELRLHGRQSIMKNALADAKPRTCLRILCLLKRQRANWICYTSVSLTGSIRE